MGKITARDFLTGLQRLGGTFAELHPEDCEEVKPYSYFIRFFISTTNTLASLASQLLALFDVGLKALGDRALTADVVENRSA